MSTTQRMIKQLELKYFGRKEKVVFAAKYNIGSLAALKDCPCICAVPWLVYCSEHRSCWQNLVVFDRCRGTVAVWERSHIT